MKTKYQGAENSRCGSYIRIRRTMKMKKKQPHQPHSIEFLPKI